MSELVLLVGTSKGLLSYSLAGRSPAHAVVHFPGLQVSMVFADPRTGTWWVGISHRHWGEKIHFSTNQGKTWQAAGVPSYAGYDYRPGNPAVLKRLWVMQQAGPDKPEGLWLGTEPGGLFYSEDYGKTFRLNENLWNHPSRLNDQQWFGTGKDFPFIHTILIDPRNSDHIYVGVSSAGVFETTDGGRTWAPRNNGLIAAYLPNTRTDVGHDPHQMLLCNSHPNVIWQQNHCGIFRTTDGGVKWNNVSGKDGVPSYGFALAIDHDDPSKAWVIPAESDASRIPPELRLQVFATTDAGETWISVSNGLPHSPSFDVVLRHAFAKHNNIMAFGTNNGNLYYSLDNGTTWVVLSQNLPPVFALTFAANQ